MANRQSARGRVEVLDNINDWMERRNADVRRLGHEAQAAAHQALGEAARTGQKIVAARPSDVLALGARLIEARRTKPTIPAETVGAPGAGRAPGRDDAHVMAPAPKSFARSTADQVLAGARGAQDAVTFGLGDRAYAGARAIADAAQGQRLGRAYSQRMADEQARDRYDATHYGAARTTGKVLGTAAQIAALGPVEGLVAGGARIAQATPLIAREVAVLGGVGGGVGVAGQAVSDVARRRVGSVGDYVGAGIGGTVGALASRGGHAGYAGAAGGAATSVAQDLANLRAPSFDRARDAALTGGVLGTAGGVAGRAWSDKLPTAVKERLGEDASRVRTWARGDRTATGPKQREYLEGGGWTVPDQRTFKGEIASDIVESKFGRSARLSKRQTQAFEQPLLKYRVDHTLPRDIGALIGFPLAELGRPQGAPKRSR